MEVYFLDVGQGASHLILLGGREAIVIDGGPRTADVLLRAMTYYRVERLVRLVTTHSHDDHTGGCNAVLTTYAGQIDQFWFLDDSNLRDSKLWKRMWELVRDGELHKSQFHRLERADQPRTIFMDTPRGIELKIYSPTFAANLLAQEATEPNATSAILVLEVDDNRIVFGSDSTLAQWQDVHQEIGGPLVCDIVAVPHHGGHMGDITSADLEWLYTEAIVADHAVLSVGTRNTYGHPRAAVIDALGNAETTVICTQITDQCCSDLELVRGGLQSPLEPIRQSVSVRQVNQRGRSKQVACAGTVAAELTDTGFHIRHLTSHQANIDRLAITANGRPLCRRQAAG
jgi:competence protein ComEC